MTYNISEAIEAQEQFCDKNEYPYFAPDNGICWDCHQNIYSENGRTRYGKKTHGISRKSTGSRFSLYCQISGKINESDRMGEK